MHSTLTDCLCWLGAHRVWLYVAAGCLMVQMSWMRRQRVQRSVSSYRNDQARSPDHRSSR